VDAPPEAVLRCQAALLARGPVAEAATALAVELADILACRRVTVSLLADDDVVVIGSSLAGEIDPRRETADALRAAAHESLDQLQSVAWPPLSTGPMQQLALAQRELAGAGQACTIPVIASDRPVGALTLERGPQPAFTPAEISLCEHVAAFAGPVLAMKRDLQAPWYVRARAAWREQLAAGGRRRTAWAAGALAALALLAAPLPWRATGPARLEGSVQRAVVAAADGFLQQTSVRPGDRISAGQALAQLSSQDLELERRRRESELRQHENAYRAAQARNDRVQMVVSQARAGEAQALLTLAETQLQRSQLTAPFDGVVIKGDLTQSLGAPVQKGEVLMVLAPSDGFRLVVEVDETDIAAVRPGQRGELALAAQPERPLRFSVSRIVPMAVAADGRNYFEVEGVLDEQAPDLRPGLTGVAKVQVGRRALASLLLHRPLAWLRLSIWSVTP
jgi:multidrug resistance efflux pump